MKKNHPFFIIFFLFLTLQSFSQNEENKWAFTFGSGSVLYSVEDGLAIGGRYIDQFPRISLSRYMFKNITFVGSISSSFTSTRKYTTFDGEMRYDFGTSENRINPYVMLGGSFINATNLTPTLNFGAGGTFWISEKFGLNGQIMYKFNEERFSSQKSHIFGSLGIVYRFSLFGGSSSSSRKTVIRDSKRKRVWDTKN